MFLVIQSATMRLLSAYYMPGIVVRGKRAPAFRKFKFNWRYIQNHTKYIKSKWKVILEGKALSLLQRVRFELNFKGGQENLRGRESIPAMRDSQYKCMKMGNGVVVRGTASSCIWVDYRAEYLVCVVTHLPFTRKSILQVMSDQVLLRN